MGLAEAGSNWGASMGAEFGDQMSKGDLDEILKRLKDQFSDAEKLDPDSVGGTSFDNISLDPATRQAQMKALNQLSGISDARGMDDIALGQNAEAMRNAAGYEQSQRGAINQNMQARGMSNSGGDIAALLSSQQGGADRASAAGMSAAAGAQSRNMQAINGLGTLGGQIHGQDYREAADKASAQDAGRQNAYKAALEKLSAMGAGRQGLENYYAADRASTIGKYSAMGGAGGGLLGSGGDALISSAGGGGKGSKGGKGNDDSGSGLATPGGGFTSMVGLGSASSGDYGGNGGWASGGYSGGGGQDLRAPVSTDPSKDSKHWTWTGKA